MLLIGSGRIGTALHRAAGADASTLIDRDHGWEALQGEAGEPVMLCVRNDDLDAVIDRVPEHRRADLVIVQNGALREYLADKGLTGVTRGLLYFAVAKKGDPISPGRTSWFTGPHGQECAAFLNRCGVEAQAIDWMRFAAKELEKLAWICVFGPLCDKHGVPVGRVVDEHYDEVAALTAEVRVIGRRAYGVDLPIDWLVHRLCDYSRSIPDYRASVKEWEWRNGWIQRTADAAGVDLPVHRAVLEAATGAANRDGG